MVLIWLMVVGIYAYVTSEISDLHMEEHAQGHKHHMYRDVLFGVYHASEEGGCVGGNGEELAAKETSALLGREQRAGCEKATNGGTFS